jgi:hypothetical protein
LPLLLDEFMARAIVIHIVIFSALVIIEQAGDLVPSIRVLDPVVTQHLLDVRNLSLQLVDVGGVRVGTPGSLRPARHDVLLALLEHLLVLALG